MAALRRLYRVFAGLLLSLSLIGCASLPQCPRPQLPNVGRAGVDVRVFISPEFSQAEREHIIAGMTMWEQATGGLIIWHLVERPVSAVPPSLTEPNGSKVLYVTFKRVTSDVQWVKEWDDEHKPRRLLGLLDPRYPNIPMTAWLVEDRLTTPRAETVVAAHEFGHALGLAHISDTKSVMSELQNDTVTHLTTHDLKALCDRYGCDPQTMCGSR